MADYFFNGLSPHDLELLTRDLLQAEWGVTLEAFGPGPDQGIDLRYARGGTTLVVQCKHYPHGAWASLRRSLAAEVPKVQKLAPARYVIATSMGLTPSRKEEIRRLFKGISLDVSDILGREDLNNLLSRHERIEAQHHKLWLTSTPILSRVVNARIFSEQAGELDAAKRKASRYVPNPSLPRALGALEEHHFVLITGVPGIGKSTLAEMILVEHLSREFEPFRIWEGVEEARSVWRRDDPQLFYFDDFLGRTGLRHSVTRNEDERLVRFIQEVRRSKNSRLILTTREYILNQAQAFMEGLGRGDLDVSKCVVDLGDYTPRIRAEILYNHLYFSDLPDGHLTELVRAKTYRAIVRHPNYNPRILESMTDSVKAVAVESEKYPDAFLAALNDPRRLWDKAFKEHLSNEARDLLLVLATLPDRTLLPKVSPAFEAFHTLRGETYAYPRGPYDWERALKELDGNFVQTQLSHGAVVLQFHNPSVRDFLEAHLCDNRRDVLQLVKASLAADQPKRLWEVVSGGEEPPDRKLLDAIAERYWSLRETPSLDARAVQIGARQSEWRERSESVLTRGAVLFDMVKSGASAVLLDAALADMTLALESDWANRVEVVSLLERLISQADDERGTKSELFRVARDVAFRFSDYLELGEWAALAQFVEQHPEWVSRENEDQLLDAFSVAAADEEAAIRAEPQADTRLGWFDELEMVASGLGVTLDLSREEIEGAPRDWDDEYAGGWRGGAARSDHPMTDASLDAFFGSLSRPGD